MGALSDNGTIERPLGADFYDTVTEQLRAIVKVYSTLPQAALTSALLKTSTCCQVMARVHGQKVLERRDFLFIALALALGGMLAVIGALVWPAENRTNC